jgi:hypothetical protein
LERFLFEGFGGIRSKSRTLSSSNSPSHSTLSWRLSKEVKLSLTLELHFELHFKYQIFLFRVERDEQRTAVHLQVSIPVKQSL